MRRLLLLALTTVTISACVKAVPMAPPAPNAAVPVAASFGQTWDAVIDVFSERNIGIQTLDRSSGLIVAAPMRVGRDSTYALSLADCGGFVESGAVHFRPASVAAYNIVVRGDSASSTVRVNVRFTRLLSGVDAPGYECNTKGVWEQETAAGIRTLAEQKAAAR